MPRSAAAAAAVARSELEGRKASFLFGVVVLGLLLFVAGRLVTGELFDGARDFDIVVKRALPNLGPTRKKGQGAGQTNGTGTPSHTAPPTPLGPMHVYNHSETVTVPWEAEEEGCWNLPNGLNTCPPILKMEVDRLFAPKATREAYCRAPVVDKKEDLGKQMVACPHSGGPLGPAGEITIVMTSSMSGSDPEGSMDRMETVLKNLRMVRCLEDAPVIISLDGFPQRMDWIGQNVLHRYNASGTNGQRGILWTEENRIRYEEYKTRLRKLERHPPEKWAENIVLLELPHLMGALQSTMMAMATVETPYVLLTQHDYFLDNPRRLNFGLLLETLMKNDVIKLLIMDRMRNFRGWCGWNTDPRYFCAKPHGLEVTRARCYVDGPQIMSVAYYHKMLKPLYEACSISDGVPKPINNECFFSELQAHPKISKVPWEDHHLFGVFLVGKKFSGPYAKQLLP